jgi:hypothetical protein
MPHPPSDVPTPEHDQAWTALIRHRERMSKLRLSGLKADRECAGLIALAWEAEHQFAQPDWSGKLRQHGIAKTRSANPFHPIVRWALGEGRSEASKAARVANTLLEWAEVAQPAGVSATAVPQWIADNGGFDGISTARDRRMNGDPPSRDDSRGAFHRLVTYAMHQFELPMPDVLRHSGASGFHNLTVYLDPEKGTMSVIAAGDPLGQAWLTKNAARLNDENFALAIKFARAQSKPHKTHPDTPEVIYLGENRRLAAHTAWQQLRHWKLRSHA